MATAPPTIEAIRLARLEGVMLTISLPKAAALTAAGFRRSATLKQRVAADWAQTGWVDVEVWENKGGFQADGSVVD